MINSIARRFIAIALLVLTIISITVGASFASSKKPIKLFVDEKEISFSKEMGEPFIENARTLVPIRVIAEEVGYEVEYDHNKDRLITIKNENDILTMNVGKNNAEFNGKAIFIDENPKVVPIVKSNRTYVPIRFVSELLGKEVIWDRSEACDTVKLVTRDDSLVEPRVNTVTYEFKGDFYTLKYPDKDNEYVKRLRDAGYYGYEGLSLTKINDSHWVWYYNGEDTSGTVWDVGTVDNLLSPEETEEALTNMVILSMDQHANVIEGKVKPVDIDGDGKITAVEERIAAMVYFSEIYTYKGIISFSGDWAKEIIKYK